MQKDSENPMPLPHLRDAAIQSQFESRKALEEWLARAVGDHWTHLDLAFIHTRKALALCPLQGRGYVYLADLSFLAGGDDEIKRACIEQAMRVRPFDGSVLYAAGSEALLTGDEVRWLEYSKRAFLAGSLHRQQIISDLVGGTPTENLPIVINFIVEEFQPDYWITSLLYALCSERCPPETLRDLARYKVEMAEAEAAKTNSPTAALIWLEAVKMHTQLGNMDGALRCVRNAYDADANNFNVRFQLAACLLKTQLFEEAVSHLKWCRSRKPNDNNVENMLKTAMKGCMSGNRRTASENEQLR